jgi:YfiH family protein
MTVGRAVSLEAAGFAHAFSQRETQRPSLLADLHVSNVVQAKQVHGARAIDARTAHSNLEADALFARAAAGRVAVGVRVADCVPVLVADPDSGDVAAIHAGWRGIVAGVIRATLAELRGRRLIAAIGPCIGPCCFEVGLDVAEAIARSAGDRVVTSRASDKAHVDLRAAVRQQLFDERGERIAIENVAGCTKHEGARFHSFRRDGTQSGRMLAAIVTRIST